MTRCKHGMIEEQCHTCKTGPVGYDGKDRNVYGDIDYLETLEPVDKAERKTVHAAAGAQEFARYASDDLIIMEIETEEIMEEKKICIITGCDNERFSRGLCKTHYWRWQKNQGKTDITPLPSRTTGKKEPVKDKKKTKPKGKKLTPADVKRIAGPESGAIENSEMMPTVEFEIMKLERENSASMQEAAKLIIAKVKKDLLGAVFAELRK